MTQNMNIISIFTWKDEWTFHWKHDGCRE